jgi:hypothetical protein
LQSAIEHALAKLPIPKVMQYQLHQQCEMPGWSTVSFVRPAHGLIALHGNQLVPVTVLGLSAGNSTHGHRFEASQHPVHIAHADAYEETMASQGAVIASFDARSVAMVCALREQAKGSAAACLDGASPSVSRREVLLQRALTVLRLSCACQRFSCSACCSRCVLLVLPNICAAKLCENKAAAANLNEQIVKTKFPAPTLTENVSVYDYFPVRLLGWPLKI